MLLAACHTGEGQSVELELVGDHLEIHADRPLAEVLAHWEPIAEDIPTQRIVELIRQDRDAH
ncbi:MAG: hypothetical protein ACRDHX_09610 [Chloroflexota bacterium]